MEEILNNLRSFFLNSIYLNSKIAVSASDKFVTKSLVYIYNRMHTARKALTTTPKTATPVVAYGSNETFWHFLDRLLWR